MDWSGVQKILTFVQHSISVVGIAIILSGVVLAMFKYARFFFTGQLAKHGAKINLIRLDLGRVLILGLEFIVAADLIGTITMPDYYEIGILAIIVAIRTLLSYSLNRELMTLSKEK